MIQKVPTKLESWLKESCQHSKFSFVLQGVEEPVAVQLWEPNFMYMQFGTKGQKQGGRKMCSGIHEDAVLPQSRERQTERHKLVHSLGNTKTTKVLQPALLPAATVSKVVNFLVNK